MGLGNLLTKLFEPCRSAPKSPNCPSPDKPKSDSDLKASANASEKTIVEVLPCGDVTTPDQGSPKPTTHAEGFSVNQVRKLDTHTRVKVEEETDEPRQKLILDAFGFEVQRMLHSKAWDERAQALAIAKEKCQRMEIQGEESVFCDACCKLALVSLQDKVMPIYFDGLELTKYFFFEFFDKLSVPKELLRVNLEELLPVIISKTADRNARSNEGTRAMLCFLARCHNVGCSPVMAHIFSPIVNFKDISAIRGRLELIDHVIAEFGFAKSSTITMQLVMGFVRPHLDATDEKVRRAAIEVTVSCFKHKGDRTLKYITNVKPALLKLLDQRFAEVSKPLRVSRKAKSAQGLPEVRGGKPRMAEAGTTRESASQPCFGASQGFRGQPTDLNSVLTDCPQLFSMGSSVGPMSSQAAAPCLASPVMPGSVPNHEFRMGQHDLDADLMDEIESY